MQNGQLIPLFLAGTIIIVLFACTLISFLVINKQKQNKFRLEQQQKDFEHRNLLLQTRLEVQEQSLMLISREIHDDVNQTLGLAKIKLALAGKRSADEQQQQLINTCKELIEQTIRDLRNISHSLNSTLVKKQGLRESVRKQLVHLEENEGINTVVKTTGEPGVLTASEELIIFRIVQEVIKNTVKHARARTLSIQLLYSENGFRLICEDDGVGFDLAGNQAHGGIGLMNMEERARLMNGTLNIVSAPGKGTRITLTINTSDHATQT